ncbi:MAG TPA: antibiotic biosynthesis monooxygenase [Spirochaetota bacterium]|nr:antibiotic biosynthesis monooxygenase [Spirochaetota bacterium]
MIVTSVRVFVLEKHIDDFIQATIENHNNSVKEPGNLRFDVLQSMQNPAEFTLYEAYDSDETAAAHKETAHYKVWRDKVAPWMAKPREGIPHRVIAPAGKAGW